jgi:hypothetical protein
MEQDKVKKEQTLVEVSMMEKTIPSLLLSQKKF